MDAFKITPQTYEVYLEMDLGPTMLPKLELRQVNNAVIIRDPAIPRGIGWLTEKDFHEYYQFTKTPANFTDFTPVTKLKPLDE